MHYQKMPGSVCAARELRIAYRYVKNWLENATDKCELDNITLKPLKSKKSIIMYEKYWDWL